MDKNIFEEKIQSIDEWMKKFEEMTLLSTKDTQKNIEKCYDLIARTNNALATQARLISDIFQMLASLKTSIEKLKGEEGIIRGPLISFGPSEN